MSQKTVEQRLAEQGIELPSPHPPGAIYKRMVVSGNMLYVSGNIPIREDGTMITGRAGDTMTTQEAKAVARYVGLVMLANIQDELGSLNQIHKLVKTLGMVNSTPDFGEQPEVINGYSELMQEVFGLDNGTGARSAVGMILPRGVAVEIEAIFELKEYK
ncbi:MAG: enamine deaminase RidA (YjgF/YER057c/UK114 family) [Cellvibrionaceae bacterium]|jgi:enamine deaminase RidA (YjgF/YER057c/UK114 family)